MSIVYCFCYLTGCYPFTDRDPFLIDSCPHVYFVGSQEKYETRLLKGDYSKTCNYQMKLPFKTKQKQKHHSYFITCLIKLNLLLTDAGLEGQLVRFICIPRFCETGVSVVVSMSPS